MTIHAAAAALGDGPLTEPLLREHVFPLFSRALAGERERGEIYLANHSLGRPPDRTADDVAGALDCWYRHMDGAWSLWNEEFDRYRGSVARLIGRGRSDAVVPKTSAGQGLRAVLNALPTASPGVVATTGEFDSIDFILRTYARRGRASLDLVPPDDAGLFHAEDIVKAITPSTDLVVFSLVVFATGQLIEHPERIIRRARECNAAVVVDTYHAAGAMPIDFDALDPDFAIGGSYKYTRGGPGACWLAVNDRHLRGPGPAPSDGLATLDTGWFAKRDPFEFRRTDEPELSAGGDAWLESTLPFLLPFQAKAGLELTLALGPHRLRDYNARCQRRLADLLNSHGVRPRLIEPRGAFLLLEHSDAPGVAAALRRAGVNTDARRCPTGRTGFVRLCPDLLSTDQQLIDAAGRIARTLRS